MKDVTKDESGSSEHVTETSEVAAEVTLTEGSPAPDGSGNDGLLVAFKSGIEQSLSLVQQMSHEERTVAYNTLAYLCGETNSLIAKLFQAETLSDPPDIDSEAANHVEVALGDAVGSTFPLGASSELSSDPSLSTEKTDTTTRRGKSQRLMAKRTVREDKPKTIAKRRRKPIVKSGTAREVAKKGKPNEHNNNNSEVPGSAGEESDNGRGSVPAQATTEEQTDENTGPHDNRKLFQCESCKKKLKSSFSLLVHLRTHTGEKPYPCHLCDKSFSCNTNCKRHVRETHEGARPFNCSRCSTGFFRQINLEMHLEEDHRLSAQELKEELAKKVVKPEFQLYLCKDCGKVFKTKSNLRVHEAVHKDEREHACPHCDKKFSFRNNLKRHLMIHTGARPHHCSTCSMGFIEAKSLKLHIRREHGGVDESGEPDKVTCEICGRQLSSKASLQNHMLTHTGSKPHVCTHCTKAFSMKSNLKRHMRSHTNDRPWECPTCFKRFTEKKSMEVHFRIHTGEKPYNCKECGKTFAQASTLQAHMPVHSKARAVSCEVCGKSFLRMSHYRFHMAKHNSPPKHACAECPRAFYRKADLERHRLTHTGVRPYQCSMCPKQFSRPMYLKDHMNLHLGQRPYTCNYCPVMYAERSTRNKHMRRCPMRFTTKCPPPAPLEPAHEIIQTEDVTQLDIVTTAMTTAALSSLTMTPGGDLVVQQPAVTLEHPANQQQVTTAAMDNLVALANSGMLTIQSGGALDVSDMTVTDVQPKVEALPIEALPADAVPAWEQLGLQTIDVNSVKEVHVQDIDTDVGKTKHYIVVLQAAPQ